MRRGAQVDAARHQRHPLQRIIDRDREMIAGRRLLARQHDVAERGGIGRDPPTVLVPGERPGARQRNADIDDPSNPVAAQWEEEAVDATRTERIVWRIENSFRKEGS